MGIVELVKFVFVGAAAFLFFHAAFAALFIIAAKKFNACFFPHAVMNFHGNAR